MRVGTGWIWTLAVAAALLAAGPAQAFNIVFDGPGGFGISASSAASAEADGVPLLVVDQISTAASLGLTIPDPDVLFFDLVGSPSVANPHTATSMWTVNKGGAGALSDGWLVFLGPTHTEGYDPSLIGFEIDGDDGWALVSVLFGGTNYYYPAQFLGDIANGGATDFQMHHRVGQPLFQQGGVFVLPQYSVGALQGILVPEPTALALLAVGVALAAGTKRRNA